MWTEIKIITKAWYTTAKNDYSAARNWILEIIILVISKSSIPYFAFLIFNAMIIDKDV